MLARTVRAVSAVKVAQRKLHTTRFQRATAKAAKSTRDEYGWPKELSDAVREMEAEKKAESANVIEVPELEYSPKSDAGLVAVKIFHSAYVMKYDLAVIEAELSNFVEEIEATPDAQKVFIDHPAEWDEAEIAKVALSTINDLTYSEPTKVILRAILEEGDMSKIVPAVASLKKLLRVYRDEHNAVVTTARPLADHEIKFYSTLFAQQYLGESAKLELTNVVDPNIIGGYKLVIDGGDQTYDQSYATELSGVDQLQQNFIRDMYTPDRRLTPRAF